MRGPGGHDAARFGNSGPGKAWKVPKAGGVRRATREGRVLVAIRNMPSTGPGWVGVCLWVLLPLGAWLVFPPLGVLVALKGDLGARRQRRWWAEPLADALGSFICHRVRVLGRGEGVCGGWSRRRSLCWSRGVLGPHRREGREGHGLEARATREGRKKKAAMIPRLRTRACDCPHTASALRFPHGDCGEGDQPEFVAQP